jgi:hypothetical protein
MNVEEKIVKKSGILEWSDENINNSPATFGVYVLRSSPINGDILSVKACENLKKELGAEKLESESGIKFFEWYSTTTNDDAALIKSELEKSSH